MDMRRECKRCGIRQEPGQMRIHPNGKDFLCKDCAALQDPKAKNLEKAKLPKRAHFSDEKDEPIVKYYCRKCKYKFKRKKGITMKACPYCGSDDFGLQEEVSAQSILDEASHTDFYGQQ